MNTHTGKRLSQLMDAVQEDSESSIIETHCVPCIYNIYMYDHVNHLCGLVECFQTDRIMY